MSKTVAQQRQDLISAYPLSTQWKTKVNKMPDDQVIAIYLRLKQQGRVP